MLTSSIKRKRKILVVGQTPPPYGGQAIMTKRLVDARFDTVEVVHVRMSFSESFLEIGKASWKKVLHVFTVAGNILKHRLMNKHLVLYYMPAGPNKVPVIRDLLLLLMVRPFFSKTIYHFRAAGVSEFIDQQPVVFKVLCKLLYGKPSVGIQLSSLNPADAAFFSAKNVYHIPNGMEDSAGQFFDSVKHRRLKQNGDTIKILFVGVLREDKGFTWLIEALSQLVQNGTSNFKLYAMGEFSSPLYEQQVKQAIGRSRLQEHVDFLGVRVGREKWAYFSEADFLCFPTYFDCESFGNVLVEAMMFRLPVVASRWRGIPDIVTDDVGFLVPVKDVTQLAEKIQLLITNSELREKMGNSARERYLKRYTLDRYLKDIEQVFHSIK